jgi:hypothetical protein
MAENERQDLLLVVGREPPALCLRHDFRVGPDGAAYFGAGFAIRWTSFGLASLVLTTSSGRQRGSKRMLL